MKGYKELLELLKKTQASGSLDISNAAICDYQDMIAHSDEDQLSELANGNLKESFYRVYGYAFGTVEAIRFHCKHGNKIQDMIYENSELKAEAEDLKAKLKSAQETAENFREYWHDENQKTITQKMTIEKQEREIIELKAKLYDMMQAGQ